MRVMRLGRHSVCTMRVRACCLSQCRYSGLYECVGGYGSVRTAPRSVVCGRGGFYESVGGDALCVAMECHLGPNDEPLRGFDLDVE